jgi:hypothetical protein
MPPALHDDCISSNGRLVLLMGLLSKVAHREDLTSDVALESPATSANREPAQQGDR